MPPPGAMAPTPILLPRPRSYEGAPDGRRVPDRVPVESLDATLTPQGYRLEVGEDAVRLVGADEAGLRHGRATLAQLRHPANAPGGFGTPDEGFRPVWTNSHRSRQNLGYDETLRWVDDLVRNCEPSNVSHFREWA